MLSVTIISALGNALSDHLSLGKNPNSKTQSNLLRGKTKTKSVDSQSEMTNSNCDAEEISHEPVF